jgi:cytoskeletal protein CcmA (bactofilin family)
MDDQGQIERDDGNPASLIGTNITVTGNIEASVDLMIEGQVNGDVRCNTLVLGENSTIKGNIFAERTRVSGVVEGSIDTKDLAIEATGNVMGDVSYTRLKIATGGTVDGSMHLKRENDQKLKLVEPEPGPRHVIIE